MSFSAMEITSGSKNAEGYDNMRLVRRYRYIGLVLLPFLLFMAIFSDSIRNFSVGGKKIRKKNDKTCLQECTIIRNQRYDQFKGKDMLNRNDLLKLVTDAKERLITKLKIDYGEENFSKIFIKDDGSFRPFLPFGDHSLDRLKRKLTIKVLSAQKALKQKEESFNGCDCINGDKGFYYNSADQTISTDDGNASTTFHNDKSFEKYVWATGGHSAAAAHGNLFNESYTAFLERDLKDVFGSIGIDFEGRNYAMGGTGSAAEIAMCFEEIFGSDLDMFSWDYGMTDVGQPIRLMHYAYRGGLSSGRPAFMAIRINLDRGDQEGIMKVLNDLGMSIFVEDDDMWFKKFIPDSFGLSKVEINEMPEYIKNFKCNDVIEKGEPYCIDEKYSRDVCEDREGKAPWHPGIKTHAIVGHSISLFLVEKLLAALEDLIKSESESLEILLERLQQEENEIYEKYIVNGHLHDYPQQLYSLDPDIAQEEKIDLNVTMFFKEKSMCHTARLPSRTRYLGYLTNTNRTGGPAPFGLEQYDVGTEVKEVSNQTSKMQLVWSDDNMHQKNCPVTISIDHKDSFLSQEGNGWNVLTIPNEAEKKAYGYEPALSHGVVVMIFTPCEWGECEESYLGPKDFIGQNKTWEMKINGETVNKLVPIGADALIAKGVDGINFSLSSKNDYEIQIKVNEPLKYVKISSVIIF